MADIAATWVAAGGTFKLQLTQNLGVLSPSHQAVLAPVPASQSPCRG
jgi:hypothetical protein